MSQRSTPIVPTFFTIGTTRRPYEVAPITRHQAVYATPTTVRGQPETGKPETIQQAAAYCLPDEAAWERVQAAHEQIRAAVSALGIELRRLGPYRQRLTEAGGYKKAPNPLTPTVIAADEPDRTISWWYEPIRVPTIRRVELERHTPQMLREKGKDYTGTSQGDHIVCPTDEDWARVEQLHGTAVRAEEGWKALLGELGTYREAAADRRYANRVQATVPASTPLATPPGHPTWPAIEAPLRYGHHRSATTGGITHVWKPTPTPRSKKRHQTLCHITMTDPPREPNWTQSGLRLCNDCRRAAEQLAATTEAHKEEPPLASTNTTTAMHTGVWHHLPPLLAGWKWDGQQTSSAYPPTAKLRAPDGWTTSEYAQSNHAIGEALRHVHSQPKPMEEPAAQALTVVEPTSTEVAPVLTPRLQDLARQFLAAMRISGEKLLEASSYVAEARERAAYGEWKVWLEATGTSEAGAEQLLNIYTRASSDDAFADAIKRNFLSRSAAALLARPSTPPDVVERALGGPTPPTVSQVRQEIAASRPPKPDTYQVLPTRPNAPAGWVWRDDNSMRRIADGVIVGPKATLADVVSAAEQMDRERSDAEHKTAIEYILAKLDQWAESARPAQIQEAYSHARQVYSLALRDGLFKLIDATVDASSRPPRPEPRGQRLSPGQPAPAPWPEAPEGWRWNRKGAPAHLIAPDGWRTQDYNYPERALAEAQRRILSQPKAAESNCDDCGGPVPGAALGARICPACVARKATGEDENPFQRSPLNRCPTCNAEILNGLWGDRNECGICHQARLRARRQTPAHPARPSSADVSVLWEYIRDLEAYTVALEERLERQDGYGAGPTFDEPAQSTADPLASAREMLATVERQLDEGTTHELTPATLETIADDLKQFVDAPGVTDAAYEELTRRLAAAQERLNAPRLQEATA